MSTRRTAAYAIAAIALVSIFADPVAAAPAFTQQPPASAVVGSTIHISGSGCPQTGSIGLDRYQPVVLWVQAPPPAEQLDMAASAVIQDLPQPTLTFLDGTNQLVNFVATDAAGNWSADYMLDPVAQGWPTPQPPSPGPGYVIKAQCLTLLEQDPQNPAKATAASLAAATFTSNTFTITAQPAPSSTSTTPVSTTTASPTTRATAVAASPRFTG